LQDILESDWTLGAVKRREEERLKRAGAARESDGETIQTPHAPHVSGDNWVAEAFRRRQEQERARAESHQRSVGDRAAAASAEALVDNWLIEGFKRHQEEERRVEFISRSDDAGAPAIGDDASNSSLKQALVVVEELSPLAPAEPAGREARADDQASSGAVGALVAVGGERALVRRRPSGAGRLIAIAGVVVVGLVSLFALKTALWNSGDSLRGFDRGAPIAPSPPAAKKEKTRSAPAGPSHGEGTPNVQPTRPAVNGVAPTRDSTARPADAAPAKPGEAATIPAPSAGAPKTSTQNPAAPGPQPESKAPSLPAAQGDESPPVKEAAPAATPAAPKGATTPAQPDKDSAPKPASVGAEKSHDGGGSEQEKNASEPKRETPNANADSKPKQQAQQKSGARRSARKTDGLSAFLKRTANSVRRFFGRLGAQQ
jgi:hypothetical protein